MKASELRIGNWVETYRLGGFFKEYQITGGFEIDNFSGESIDLVRPIPLTEEWLTRFGFDKTYSELSYREYDFGKIGVEINSDKLTVSYNYGSDVEWVNFTHIKHVHQLQNLYFALTGEELTIKE